MQWTGLAPDEARENLEQKDKSKRDKRMSLTEAVTEFVKIDPTQIYCKR